MLPQREKNEDITESVFDSDVAFCGTDIFCGVWADKRAG